MSTVVVAQWKLRTLGLRAMRIGPRVAQLDEGLAALSELLVASAQTFIETYDAARAFEAQRGAEMEQGRSAIEALNTRVRVWFGALQRDVPGFESARIEGSIDQPDLLLADAQRMLEVVQAQDGTLAYADKLVTQLSSAMEQAETQWTGAREAIAKQQELRAVARTHALELHKQLVVFRRALRAVVGSSHHDYQNLRTSRMQSEEAQEEVEPESQTAVELEVSQSNVTAPAPTNGHSTQVLQAQPSA